jgi:hypothetical protein
MFENVAKILGSTPLSASGLVFPKTALEIKQALEERVSAFAADIARRRAEIESLIEADGSEGRATVDAVIAIATNNPYAGRGFVTAPARAAMRHGKAIAAQKAVLEILELCNDNFDPERFRIDDEENDPEAEYDMLDLSFLDLRFLFKEQDFDEDLSEVFAQGVAAMAAPMGLGTMMGEPRGGAGVPREMTLGELLVDSNKN